MSLPSPCRLRPMAGSTWGWALSEPSSRVTPWHGSSQGLWRYWMLRSGVCVALTTSLSPIMF